jgi:hypothetical protein
MPTFESVQGPTSANWLLAATHVRSLPPALEGTRELDPMLENRPTRHNFPFKFLYRRFVFNDNWFQILHVFMPRCLGEFVPLRPIESPLDDDGQLVDASQ